MPAEGKIKSKDLSYDTTLPPFLQRLHDRHGGGRGDPDQHERAAPRPTKAKNPDEDDGPTVVDESGELLSKEDLAKLNRNDAVASDGKLVDSNADLPVEGDVKRVDAKVTDGVANKKRKVAKVIGDDDDDDESPRGRDAKDLSVAKPAKKSKKKAKSIKLAFDDGDET